MKEMIYKKQLEAVLADEKEVEKEINAAAGVIARVVDDDRVEILLIQRASDDHWPLHWEFPRGKCDKPIGEDLIHCLKREVKEETGLDIKAIEKVDVHEYLAEGGKRKTYCHNYLCIMKNPDQPIKLSKEHDNYKWITELGEVELMVMPEQKKTLEKVLNTDRSIVSYPHNDENQTIEEYLKYLDEIALTPIAGVYFGAMLAKLAHDFYQQNYSKFAKECKGLPATEKTICMLDAKTKAKQMEVNKLKSAMAKCSKARKPDKCKKKLTNKINQAAATMKLTKNRMLALKRR